MSVSQLHALVSVHEIFVRHSLDLTNTSSLMFLDRLSPFCRVVEAAHGQEALNLLDRVKPNLILSDVMMPGENVSEFDAFQV